MQFFITPNNAGNTLFPFGAGAHEPTCILNHASTQESRPGSYILITQSSSYFLSHIILRLPFSLRYSQFLLLHWISWWLNFSEEPTLRIWSLIKTFGWLQLLNKSTNSLVVSLFFFPFLGAHSHRIFFLQFITFPLGNRIYLCIFFLTLTHWVSPFFWISLVHCSK